MKNDRMKAVFDNNLEIAGKGLLGFAVKKLAPTKENLKKFREQFSGPLCGCIGCMELSKNFILENHAMKEEVVTASMKDLDILKQIDYVDAQATKANVSEATRSKLLAPYKELLEG